MVVGMSLYSQIREAYVSGESIMSNYIIQIRLPDCKCTGKFHFSIILSLASSHKKSYMIRNSPLSILAYSFIKNTVTNILSPAQPIPSVQSSACPHSVLSLKLGHIRKSLRLSTLPFLPYDSIWSMESIRRLYRMVQYFLPKRFFYNSTSIGEQRISL